MEHAEGPVEMEGEVEFRRDIQSNQTKAVSGTEWMYQRRALERGKLVGVFVCSVHAGGWAFGRAGMHTCVRTCIQVYVCVCTYVHVYPCGY